MIRLLRIGLGVFVACAILGRPGSANAAHVMTATSDAYDCGFLADGTLVEGTAGGLKIGSRLLTSLDGLPDTWVQSVSVEGNHVVVGTRRGAARVDARTFQVSQISTEGENARPRAVSSAHTNRALTRRHRTQTQGSCTATSRGVVVASEGKSALPEPNGNSLPSGNIAASVMTSHGLFLGLFDQGLVKVTPNPEGSIHRIEDPAIHPMINALGWDEPRSTLWIGTARGLVRCETQARLTCRRVGGSRAQLALHVRKDGSVVAGGEGGLMLVGKTGNVRAEWTRKTGAPFRAVWAIAESDQGGVFFGTTTGLYWWEAKEFGRIKKLHRGSMVDRTLPDDWVTAIHCKGDLVYVGTYNSGVVRLRRVEGQLQEPSFNRELGYVNPGGIAQLTSGELSVSTMQGLRVGSWGLWRTVDTVGRDVTGISESPWGRWATTRRGMSTF